MFLTFRYYFVLQVPLKSRFCTKCKKSETVTSLGKFNFLN